MGLRARKFRATLFAVLEILIKHFQMGRKHKRRRKKHAGANPPENVVKNSNPESFFQNRCEWSDRGTMA
jgi:hypothetical protein